MMRRMWRTLTLAVALVGCGGDSSSGPRTTSFGGDRPAELKVPAMLTEGKQYPLLVVLHGYSATGLLQAAFFGVGDLPAADRALVIAPDGTTNSMGKQFWNADPACCDFDGQNPDDVAYIGGLIDDIKAEWPVDPGKVFILGHSNGGYMAYRMACERADAIAAIASLAGNAASMPAGCNPAREVSVVHMHGTADEVVPYTGAVPSVDQWAAKNGCGTTRTQTADLDLDNAIAGSETHVQPTADCPPTGAVELWTMEGSSHIPVMNSSFSTTLLDWFDAHAR